MPAKKKHNVVPIMGRPPKYTPAFSKKDCPWFDSTEKAGNRLRTKSTSSGFE